MTFDYRNEIGPQVLEPVELDGFYLRVFVSGLETWKCATEAEFRQYVEGRCQELAEKAFEVLLPKWRGAHKPDEA